MNPGEVIGGMATLRRLEASLALVTAEEHLRYYSDRRTIVSGIRVNKDAFLSLRVVQTVE